MILLSIIAFMCMMLYVDIHTKDPTWVEILFIPKHESKVIGNDFQVILVYAAGILKFIPVLNTPFLISILILDICISLAQLLNELKH